jgi:hypothetical protein
MALAPAAAADDRRLPDSSCLDRPGPDSASTGVDARARCRYASFVASTP